MSLLVSKSKFLAGLQCPRLLWTYYNDRGLIPAPGPAQQFIFDTGHLVGDLAKQRYPDGIEIRCDRPDGRPDIPATVAETARLLPLRKPLFEASFSAEGRYVRADILVPAAENAWDLIEVKSSTSVKKVNLWDVAYQHDCLTLCGVELRRVYVMHLDNTYVKDGPVDPLNLFHPRDVTQEVLELISLVPPLFDRHRTIIAGGDPQTPIGPHCRSPYPCPLISECWADLPPHHVTEMYYAGKKAFKWLDSGWNTIDQVPADKLSPVQIVQQNAVASGREYFDADAVGNWLAGLRYPLWHLDFETMNPAVPLFDGTRPYQRIPFQFSLHMQAAPGSEPRHMEYLAEDPVDPRPRLLEKLRVIGPEGTVLAFNKSFELGVLAELGEDFPAFGAMCADISNRMKDLAAPFQHFDAYHPDQHGKYSLKAVLPAWTSLNYDDLDIRDGQAAARAFMRAVFPRALGFPPESVGPAHKAKILADLRSYCRLDTLAMVELLKVMYKRAPSPQHP